MKKDINEKIFGKKFGHAPNNDSMEGKVFKGRKVTEMDQVDWLRRQKEYMNISEKVKTRYDLKRGEIYEFDFGINVNAEFSFRHYGVVMCDSSVYDPLVIVCPLKTRRIAHPRNDVVLGVIPSLSETVQTIAVVNQIRSLDKFRLYTRNAIGTEVGEDGVVLNRNEITTCDEGRIAKVSEEGMRKIHNLYKLILEHGDSDHLPEGNGRRFK